MSDDAPPKPSDATAAASGMSPERREKCNANLRPWEPGQSGNPAGRPSEAGLFRASCRRLAEKGVKRLDKMLDLASIDDGSAEAMKQVIAVIEKMGDRGGYLPADRLAAAQATWYTMAQKALEAAGDRQEERAAVFAELEARTTEALGLGPAESDEGGDDASGD